MIHADCMTFKRNQKISSWYKLRPRKIIIFAEQRERCESRDNVNYDTHTQKNKKEKKIWVMNQTKEKFCTWKVFGCI